jgi:hypothetical protein
MMYGIQISIVSQIYIEFEKIQQYLCREKKGDNIKVKSRSNKSKKIIIFQFCNG